MQKKFKKVYVEITNICNLSCSFCAPSHRKPEHMNVTLFEKIAMQIAPYTDHVYLHIKGEPLAHPDIGDILEICSVHNLYANITTNGICLHENTELLTQAQALRQVNISLHAETKDPQKYMNDALEYAKIAAEAGKYTCFRLWNGDAGDKMVRELKEIFCCTDEAENRITLAPNIFLSRDSFWEWPSITNPEISKIGTCAGLRHQLGVLVDGSVVPCCLDGEGGAVLGNVKTEVFDDIYQKKILTHRENMQNNKLSLDLCQKCTYRKKFVRK